MVPWINATDNVYICIDMYRHTICRRQYVLRAQWYELRYFDEEAWQWTSLGNGGRASAMFRVCFGMTTYQR